MKNKPLKYPISCLIIDTMHESIVPMLEKSGIKTTYLPHLPIDEIPKVISNYEGLILRSKLSVNHHLLDQAQRLQFIARAGAGLDNIDLEETTKRGIHVIHAAEGNSDTVAEHTIGLILSLLHKIVLGSEQVKHKLWDREYCRGVELKEKTVGIIGYGTMGKAVAQRLSSFGCKVIAYDKYKTEFSDDFAKAVSLNELYNESDIATFHIPLTKENTYLIDKAYIYNFKKPFYLVNTSRGELIKMSTLQEAIEKNKIRGAALDVLENEKLSTFSKEQENAFQYLTQSHKVIFTPHVAGWSNESYYKINEIIVQKIQKLLEIN